MKIHLSEPLLISFDPIKIGQNGGFWTPQWPGSLHGHLVAWQLLRLG